MKHPVCCPLAVLLAASATLPATAGFLVTIEAPGVQWTTATGTFNVETFDADHVAAGDYTTWSSTSIGGSTGLLRGTLDGVPAGTAYTVFWRGQHTVPSASGNASHLFQLNTGSLTLGSGRRVSAGTPRIELWDDNIPFLGASIAAYDNQTTVWSTVFSGTTHRAYANGTDLAVAGTPSYSLGANPTLSVGGFAGAGQFNGEVSDLIVFNSALSDADRALVEG